MPDYASVAMHHTPNIVFPLTSIANINGVALYAVFYDDRNWSFKLKHHLFPVRDSNPYTPPTGDVTTATLFIALHQRGHYYSCLKYIMLSSISFLSLYGMISISSLMMIWL